MLNFRNRELCSGTLGKLLAKYKTNKCLSSVLNVPILSRYFTVTCYYMFVSVKNIIQTLLYYNLSGHLTSEILYIQITFIDLMQAFDIIGDDIFVIRI